MKTFCFLGLAIFFVAFLFIPKISSALDPFSDSFQRADSATVGNGWEEIEDAGISASIVNGEVLIKGKETVDWLRDGIARNVNDISSVSFDFLCNDQFNVHIRIDDTNAKGYLEIYTSPGGVLNHANSADGGWPGWVEIAGAQSVAGKYNTLGINKVSANKFQVMLNGAKVGDVLNNAGINNVNRIQLSSDSAVGTVGSLHFDNVTIDGGISSAVNSSAKLSTVWGAIKRL
jgi:hypothetical protein